ncbi:hypothetical protein HPB50_019386 [Hyalomma asiaticum]|uniref:Uncharacterized protein n=1 Tax=Hyalomma asiaticum TaxID=266040 RepID=A0ACB7RRU5_HYAAI|nr:hypothetical protein HPB50_019386 [Hyalomma asiaticum]
MAWGLGSWLRRCCCREAFFSAKLLQFNRQICNSLIGLANLKHVGVGLNTRRRGYVLRDRRTRGNGRGNDVIEVVFHLTQPNTVGREGDCTRVMLSQRKRRPLIVHSVLLISSNSGFEAGWSLTTARFLAVLAPSSLPERAGCNSNGRLHWELYLCEPDSTSDVGFFFLWAMSPKWVCLAYSSCWRCLLMEEPADSMMGDGGLRWGSSRARNENRNSIYWTSAMHPRRRPRIAPCRNRIDACRGGKGISDNPGVSPSDITISSGSKHDAGVVLWKLRQVMGAYVVAGCGSAGLGPRFWASARAGIGVCHPRSGVISIESTSSSLTSYSIVQRDNTAEAAATVLESAPEQLRRRAREWPPP